MTLNDLAVGDSGTVKDVIGDDDIGIRLMEMGLVPGTRCQVVGTAPLGDPVEIELRGYRLSIRRSEAERIEMLPLQ